MTQTIILSSGGTGGHVFPALSLAQELHGRGYRVVIMTDCRGGAFQKARGVSKVVKLPIWRGRGWLRPIALGLGLGVSFFLALGHMMRLRPRSVLGFGGYPSLPPVLAAYAMGIPIGLHEQNAILGRANRFAARFVKRLGVSYGKVKFIEPWQDKTLYIGNPVRQSITAIRDIPYAFSKEGEPFRLLIIGGSQGARIFSQTIPRALRNLPSPLLQRLVVYQQCRKEFVDMTRRAYGESGIAIELQPFFEDMDQQLRQAHFVIARAGASTVAELTAVGRPALFVPYPFAMDNHQQANAMSLAEGGAAWVILEQDFTSEKLQELLQKAMEDPNALETMALRMHRFGQPDAAVKLAQMTESL